MAEFDLKRFSYLLRYTIVSERWRIFRIFIGFTLACFFFMMLFMYGGANLSKTCNADLSSTYLIISVNTCLIIYFASMFIGSSMIFSNMSAFRGRVSFLMIPSSSIEKFFVRWIEVVVIGTLVFVLALILADILRMLLLPLLIDNHYSAVFPAYFSATYDVVSPHSGKINLISEDSYSVGYATGVLARRFVDYRGALSTWYVVSFGILVQSAYLLCGYLFRKHAWIFGTLALTVLFSLSFCVPKGYVPYEITLCILLAVANYVMAYNLFKRTQVINNKLVNL